MAFRRDKNVSKLNRRALGAALLIENYLPCVREQSLGLGASHTRPGGMAVLTAVRGAYKTTFYIYASFPGPRQWTNMCVCLCESNKDISAL